MKSFLKLLILLPLVAIITTFAVANRTTVPVTIDPFGWFDLPQASIPLFLLLFGAAAVGVVIGGSAVWLAQGRHRKAARLNARMAARHKAELDRLSAGSDTPGLPVSSTIR